jgi:RHS repeat-associated protein
VYVNWPAPIRGAYHQGDATGGDWVGSLIPGMQDASGLLYKRNRYYSPETGQFTQTDPIGIAGGLNTYGFGEGDPVSYSDPYGLCPEYGDVGELGNRYHLLDEVRIRAMRRQLPAQRSTVLAADIATLLQQSSGSGMSLLGEELRGSPLNLAQRPGRLAVCLRACELGKDAIERFCRAIPIREPRARALCWAVTLASEPVCKGFCYAREWEGWW